MNYTLNRIRSRLLRRFCVFPVCSISIARRMNYQGSCQYSLLRICGVWTWHTTTSPLSWTYRNLIYLSFVPSYFPTMKSLWLWKLTFQASKSSNYQTIRLQVSAYSSNQSSPQSTKSTAQRTQSKAHSQPLTLKTSKSSHSITTSSRI